MRVSKGSRIIGGQEHFGAQIVKTISVESRSFPPEGLFCRPSAKHCGSFHTKSWGPKLAAWPPNQSVICIIDSLFLSPFVSGPKEAIFHWLGLYEIFLCTAVTWTKWVVAQRAREGFPCLWEFHAFFTKTRRLSTCDKGTYQLYLDR